LAAAWRGDAIVVLLVVERREIGGRRKEEGGNREKEGEGERELSDA
jgi:hypothetical protein